MVLIPEKEQSNRDILCYYAHFLLTPQSVLHLSLVCHKLSWLPQKQEAPLLALPPLVSE